MMNPFKVPKVADAKKAGESKWGYAMIIMASITFGCLGAFWFASNKFSSGQEDCEKKYQALVERVFMKSGVIDDPSKTVIDSSAFWKSRADSVRSLMNQLMENKEIIKK